MLSNEQGFEIYLVQRHRMTAFTQTRSQQLTLVPLKDVIAASYCSQETVQYRLEGVREFQQEEVTVVAAKLRSCVLCLAARG